MSDLVGNPKDRFSHVTAHFIIFFYYYHYFLFLFLITGTDLKTKKASNVTVNNRGR